MFYFITTGMMKTISAFYKKPLEWFPLLKEWARFPGFTGWLGLSAGIAGGALLFPLISFSSIFYNEVLLVAIILSLLCALFSSSLHFRVLWFFIAGAALVCFVFCQQRTEYSSVNSLLGPDRHARLSGTIISVPEQSFGRYAFLVRCDSVFSPGKPGVLKKKCVQCYCEQKPAASGTIVATGRFAPPHPAANPGGFDEYLFSISNGIWGKFYCDSMLLRKENHSPWSAITFFARNTVVKAASSMKNSDARAVLVASFINDRSDLTDSIKDLFFKAGIFHLLALSGFNIAILSAALFAFLLLFPVARELKFFIVLACIWSYLFFIGPIPSLARAVIMTSVVLVSFLFQRKPFLINSLGLAGIVWLLFSPFSLFTPGYQLSFCATFGLAALYPALSGTIGFHGVQASLIKKAAAPLLTALFVSIAAFCATVPVLAWHFGTLSISGIIVNLFAVFLMSLSMWIALAGFFLQIFIPPLVPFCMHAAEFCILLMLKCAGFVSLMPMSTIQIPRFFPAVYAVFALFTAGLCVVKSNLLKRYLLIAGTGAVLAIAGMILWQCKTTAPQIVFFMVKKANVTGIRWPNGKIWLAGFGETSPSTVFARVVAPWMRLSPGIKLESVLLSGDPCNAVQSLEPVLKNVSGISILSCDSVTEKCPDFVSFLNEYRAGFSTINTKGFYSPSPGCTLRVIPEDKTNSDNCRNFMVSMPGINLKIPDSLISPTEDKGATLITFRKGRVPAITSAIPAWHPILARQQKCLD
jgi:ComEC/Rec2-related protein